MTHHHTDPRTFLTPQPGDTRAAATRAVFGAVLASVAVVVATVGADVARFIFHLLES